MNSEADDQLRGTPYLISSGESVSFSRLQDRSLQIRDHAIRTNAMIERSAANMLDPFRSALRTELVAESNRLEGYDWSTTAVRNLVHTHAELLSAPLHNFLTALRSDARVFEALGLYRAHQLADEWAIAGQRPREFEIRALHALLAAGEEFAGAYKSISNSIGGSTHRTTEPWDVPRAMEELVMWWRGSQNDPILDATVVHAWLTHIHPFFDGNGRMARLLANLTLIQAKYPSLILRSDSDRGQYYEALAQSDAGDILPLYELFTKVTRRTVRIMSNPDYVLDVITDRLLTSADNAHVLWRGIAQEFSRSLGRHLADHGWSLEIMGFLDRTSFALLLDRDPEGNGWYLRVRNDYGTPKWLLWFGYITDDLLAALPRIQLHYPSIFISARDYHPAAPHPYQWVDRHAALPTEIFLQPLATRPVVYRNDSGIHYLPLDTAAEELAMLLVQFGNIWSES